jgi:DNA-binding protein YbaB
MRKAQADRAAAVLEGRAAGGAVSIRITGTLEVHGVTIAPAAAADPANLQALIAAALADALARHRDRFGGTPEEQMAKVFQHADMSAMMGMMK